MACALLNDLQRCFSNVILKQPLMEGNCPVYATPQKLILDTSELKKPLLEQLNSPPPPVYGAWNGRLQAQAPGVAANWVWATLRQHEISLQQRHSWCLSTDPEFARKAVDIGGFTCTYRKMRWCCGSMKGRIFRPWSGSSDGCG